MVSCSAAIFKIDMKSTAAALSYQENTHLHAATVPSNIYIYTYDLLSSFAISDVQNRESKKRRIKQKDSYGWLYLFTHS